MLKAFVSRRIPTLFEALEDRRHLSLTVKLDYSYDTSGFFAQQQRRDVLQAAVDAVAGHFQDRFAAITPGGGNRWRVSASNPSGDSRIVLDNPNLPADTIRLYVGSRPLLDRNAIATTDVANVTDVFGDAAWEETVRHRGRPVPADGGLATPTMATVNFDSDTNWYFGLAADGIAGNQIDLFSVAQHELGHVLGVGTDTAWFGRVKDNAFTGATSRAVYGGPVPTTYDGGGHLASGVHFDGRQATMAYASSAGGRFAFTRLDYALFDDMGYDVSLPPPLGRYGGVVGYAFYDANGNNTRDNSESGFGATVYADLNANGEQDYGEFSTVTDASGKFLLSSVPAGKIRLGVSDPFGQYKIVSPSSPYSVTIKADTVVASANFVGRLTGTPNARIVGSVYNDADDNGTYTKGETPRAGLIVYLDANDNKVLDAGEASVLTDAGGVYRFDRLLAGTYRVRFALPVNTRLTTRRIDVTVGVNEQVAPTPAGVLTRVGNTSISGFAFKDANQNGRFDAGEGTLAGRTVFLDLNANARLDANEPSVVTKAGGTWAFGKLMSDVYYVNEVLPAGERLTTEATEYTLYDGDVITGQAIGSLVTTGAGVSGKAFIDANTDGYPDADEKPLAGVIVYLDTDNDAVLDPSEARKTTAADGTFYFVNVPNTGPDTRLRVVLPAGAIQTRPVANDGSYKTSLEVGDIRTDRNFGIVLPAATGSLAGFTFDDKNANGVLDAGDVKTSGKTVFLDANANGKLDSGEKSVKSAADGSYGFTGLAAGSYHVRRVFPSGYTYSTTPIDVTLSAGQSLAGLGIGSRSGTTPPPVNTSSIAGVAFNDANKNGKYDSGDSLAPDKTIWLDIDDDGVKDANEPSVATGSNGSFLFKNLAAGKYHVRRVFSTGYAESTPAAYVTLTSGQAATGVLIGSKLK